MITVNLPATSGTCELRDLQSTPGSSCKPVFRRARHVQRCRALQRLAKHRCSDSADVPAGRMMLLLQALPSAVLLPSKWSDSRAGLQASRDALVSKLEAERLSVARTELELAELDAQLTPAKQAVLPAQGYLSKTAGCYQKDGSSGPPPSAMTLALNNFGRELKELTASVLPYETRDIERTFATDEAATYAEALKNLTLSNDAIWAREDARPSVPAPLVIRLPYLALCGVLDTLYDGRPIARFWYRTLSLTLPLSLSLSLSLTLTLTLGAFGSYLSYFQDG